MLTFKLRNVLPVIREDLPVVLSLPEILRDCEVRQYISSLCLLGKGKIIILLEIYASMLLS
jgi:hypothetical protein